jgi:hypothetical protein
VAVPLNTVASRPSDDALLTFRAAAAQQHGEVAGIDNLRDSLRRFVALARLERLAPEQVLIRLKQALDDTAAIDDSRAAQRSWRARIISLAIVTYYDNVENDRGTDGQ